VCLEYRLSTAWHLGAGPLCCEIVVDHYFYFKEALMKRFIVALMAVMFLGATGVVLADEAAAPASTPAAAPAKMEKKAKKMKKKKAKKAAADAAAPAAAPAAATTTK